MDRETYVPCPICKRAVPVIDLRIYEGKRICGNCYAKFNGAEFSIPENKKDLRPKTQQQREETLRYRCSSCNYKFSRPKGFEVTHVCPFCGKRGTIDKEVTTSDVLSQLSESADIIDGEEALAAKKKRVMGY